MEEFIRQISAQEYHPIEDILTFTIPQEMYDVYNRVSGPILALIISSKPDAVIRLFDTKRTSYASWINHVVTSDIVREKNWKTFMRWVRNNGPHETSWAIAAAELISAVRHILRYDVEYIDYSAQFLVDFVDRERGRRAYMKHKQHYCFSYPVAKALEFLIEAGIPEERHWKYVGCRPQGPPNFRPGIPRVFVQSCVEISSVQEALPYLEFHPISASLAFFEPDYYTIQDAVYRGPMYKQSIYKGCQIVNIYAVNEVNGETIALVKSSHATIAGDVGYFEVSADVEMIQVPWEGQAADANFSTPRRLLSDFSFPTFA